MYPQINYWYIYITHILHTRTVQKTALLADEGNSAYYQSSGAYNIKHI